MIEGDYPVLRISVDSRLKGDGVKRALERGVTDARHTTPPQIAQGMCYSKNHKTSLNNNIR